MRNFLKILGNLSARKPSNSQAGRLNNQKRGSVNMKKGLKLLLSLLLLSAAPFYGAGTAKAGIFSWPCVPQGRQAEIVLTAGGPLTLNAALLEEKLGVKGLSGVTLTALPASGQLTLDGAPAVCWQHLDREALSGLRYQPEEGVGAVSLSLVLALPDSVPASLTLTAADDLCPPVVEPREVVTALGMAVSGRVRAWDDEEGVLTAELAQPPKKGQLTLSGLTFHYEPYPGEHGRDSFTLQVKDAAGNAAEAVYSVTVEKKALPVYADLSGSELAYSAGKLWEAGILRGGETGGFTCFEPERAVTRGELICLILKAMDVSIPENAVSTGVADWDGATPLWQRGAVAEAQKRGIIAEKGFDACETPTVAEAAVYLFRAGGFEEGKGRPNWADLAETPDWALGSLITLDQAGVFDPADGMARPNDALTRGRLAPLLWQFSQWMEGKA